MRGGLRFTRLLCGLAVLCAAIFAAGCGGGSGTTTSQPFEPHATLRAIGGTVRTDKPKLVMRVATNPGDANIRSVTVNLPPVVLVDTQAIRRLCSRGEMQSNHCAGRQRLGFAQVHSPAYKAPVSGPVYAVSGPKGFSLVYVLSGPVNSLLEGRVVSKGGRMQAGVEDIPDVPLKTFELTIEGGKAGYLVLDRNICGAEEVAEGTFTSQEGQVHRQKIPLVADCPT
jgi:hypothetical protein